MLVAFFLYFDIEIQLTFEWTVPISKQPSSAGERYDISDKIISSF
jgi:hypothetical protein